MIYRFTHDGKLVHSKGQLGVRGRGPNTFDRPTDIAVAARRHRASSPTATAAARASPNGGR